METSNLISTGIIVIFIGMCLVFFGALAGMHKGESKVAVGGFIGFIPFGFANDKRMLYFVIGLSILLFLFFILTNFFLNK